MKLIGTRLGILVGLSVAVIAVVGAPAAQAAPALQVSQSTGLTAGQTITVTLDGLPANMAAVAVGQCKPQITSPGDCNLPGSMLGAADGQGKWQPNGDKRSIALVANVGGTDCTAAPGACTISVTSLANATEIIASVPLAFGPAADSPKPAAVQNNAVDADDSDDNSAVMIGISAGAVVIIAAAVVLLARRRSRNN